MRFIRIYPLYAQAVDMFYPLFFQSYSRSFTQYLWKKKIKYFHLKTMIFPKVFHKKFTVSK